MSNFTPWWHPATVERKLENLYVRNAVRSSIQVFFANADFIEVETPSIQVCPGMEPHLHAFATEMKSPLTGSSPRYLHTSPELAMKKLLVGGLPNIFQFARVFRNNESSTTHHPEFIMLEWYRTETNYRSIMRDCESVLKAAAEFSANGKFQYNQLQCDPNIGWNKLTAAEAFLTFANINIWESLADSDAPDRDLLATQAEDIAIKVDAKDSWDDIFFRIFLERIERNLGVGAPTILYEYPAHMAALSKLSPHDSRVAERFELYVCGLELANAFSELTDAKEQRRRFEIDAEMKQKLYGMQYPIDEDFLAALEMGMPDSAGIALGFGRLVMLTAGADSIEDVLWSPVR